MKLSSNYVRRSIPLAFTLIELLVVIAIVAVLASLLLPVLAKAKAKAQAIQCAGHTKQLILAWQLYAGDANDKVVNNYSLGPLDTTIQSKTFASWANNIMSWDVNGMNTNLTYVRQGPFAPYVSHSTEVYQCPADRYLSPAQRQRGWSRRTRSMSMNGNFGRDNPTTPMSPDVYLRTSDVPSPAQVYVFLEEHPQEMNDGWFLAFTDGKTIIDMPASHHNGASALSFADGHTEIHRWLDASFKQPVKPDPSKFLNYRLPAPRDLRWLGDRSR